MDAPVTREKRTLLTHENIVINQILQIFSGITIQFF